MSERVSHSFGLQPSSIAWSLRACFFGGYWMDEDSGDRTDKTKYSGVRTSSSSVPLGIVLNLTNGGWNYCTFCWVKRRAEFKKIQLDNMLSRLSFLLIK